MEYIIASLIAIILGQVVNHLIRILPPILELEDAPKRLWGALKQKPKLDYIYTLIHLAIFNLATCFLGRSVQTYIYLIAISMLMVIFVIDLKYQLIPDTTQVVLCILGTINIGLNYTHALTYILGGLAGGIIFLLIGIIGKLAYKKEGMGMGDTKLMFAIGLIFGLKNILIIATLSFFLAAFISIILIIFKVKKLDGYIPFGPFIVISATLIIFFGSDVFINTYISVCSSIGLKVTDLLFKVLY